MKNSLIKTFVFLLLFGCSKNNNDWQVYDESSEIKFNENHTIERMQFKLIQSKFNDKIIGLD